MKYAIKNMTILDGHTNMVPYTGKAIIVDGEKISAIVPESEIPNGLTVIDLNGGYLLPGLINLHIHTPAGGRPTKKKMDYEKLARLLRFGIVRKVIKSVCVSNVKKQLLSGTTTIRAVGGVLDFDTKIRDEINSGKITGPRMFVSNCAISVEGGHMTGSVALAAHSPAEAVEMVRERAEENVDLIKLMITGGVLDAEVPGEPGILKMPKEYVKAAADEAHKLGFRVAAHVEGTEGMVIALENGVDSIEHGGKPNEDTVRLFKEKGAFLVGTLSPAIPFVKLDKSVFGLSDTDLLNGKALFANMKECICTCLENGITVGLGTDAGCPFTTHYDTWRELYYFCKYCSVTPEFAIHTATEVNARILGIDSTVGTVDAGKSADFLIVKNNPLDDITALRYPSEVFIKGKRIKNPKAKHYKVVDTEIDKVF